jgi:choice-of-anchor B domain-containing protein
MRWTPALILAGVLVLAAPRGGSALPEREACTPSAAVFSVPLPEAPTAAVPCVDGMAGIYPCSNVDLLSNVRLSTMGCNSGNSLFGWTDPQDGKEYALMGCDNGLAFVDISDPVDPVFLGKLPGHDPDGSDHGGESLWRDVRVYANHAYVGSEAPGHGLQVFDLTQLRNVSNPPVTFAETAHYDGYGHSHTTAVNTATGFIYAVGSDTCNGGIHMVNVQDPVNPTFAGCVSGDGYVHETQCTIYSGPDADYAGHEICFNANEDTLTIVDVTDKSAPVQISRTGYAGSGYTHQGWLTEGHRYFLLNDELDEVNFGHNSYTYMWDLADLDAPILMGHYRGPTDAIDHNLYVRGGYCYESNYRAGLRILDVTGVAAKELVEVAYFDFYPEDDQPEFNANWNNYPYFESGVVILSGIEQGLFVVQPHLDPNPTSLLIGDTEVTEGDAGEVVASFGVSLSRAVPNVVTVDFATESGSAIQDVDFESASGLLTFQPGETSKVVDVTVFGDVLNEADETFRVRLSNAQNARIPDSTGTGKILNDDPEPALSVSDAGAVVEGDGPGVTASFTVTLSAVSGQNVSAQAKAVDGTASSNDYTATNVTLIFVPGQTSKTVSVAVTGDERDESDEFFLLQLSSSNNASISDGEATGTIQDDDTLLVSAIDPASGDAAGGVAVTLAGESFEAGATVTVGGVDATGIGVPDPGQITATTPALSPGTMNDVAVSIAGVNPATLAGGFFADFLDVSSAHLFHDHVVAVARAAVTAGCGPGIYCPAGAVTRAQMAVFLLKGKYGASHVPPPATGTLFDDVPADAFAADWIEELAGLGVTGGCGGNNYCPDAPVTRAQMAVFLLKALLGSAYTPPAATGVFDDVPPGAFADAWIEDLYGRGITGGCSASPLLYCPASPNNRGQMAVFLTKTFGL